MYSRKLTSCGNICGWGPGGNNCCQSCFGCNSYGSTCTYGCATACDATHRGGSLRLEDNSTVILTDVVFESNYAFGTEQGQYTYGETPVYGSGNIFATSNFARLFLVDMSMPSLIMGVTPLPCSKAPGLAQWVRLSKDSMQNDYYFHEVQAFGPGGEQYIFVGSTQSLNSGAYGVVNCYDDGLTSGNCHTGTGAWSMMFDLGSPKKVETIKIYGLSDQGSPVDQRASGTKVSLGMEVDDAELWSATFTSLSQTLNVGDLTTKDDKNCFCGAGNWSEGGVCKLCAAGKWSNTIAADQCNNCTQGKWSNEGGTSCKECQDGYTPNADKSGCVVEGSDP